MNGFKPLPERHHLSASFSLNNLRHQPRPNVSTGVSNFNVMLPLTNKLSLRPYCEKGNSYDRLILAVLLTDDM